MPNASDAVDSIPERVEAKFLETKRALKFTGWGSGILLFIVVATLVARMSSARSTAEHGSLLAGLAVPTAAFAAGVLLGLLFARVGSFYGWRGARYVDEARARPLGSRRRAAGFQGSVIKKI
jgi:hypothetical protein